MSTAFPRSVSIGRRDEPGFSRESYNFAIVLHSNSSVANGALERSLNKINIKRTVFKKINPKTDIVELFTNILNEDNKNKIDCIISIGGGSIIDIGKILKFLILSKYFPQKLYEGKTNQYLNYINTTERQLTNIAIVTLSGSGSESSNVAVHNYKGGKYFFIHNKLIPDHVLYDYKSYKSLNKEMMLFHLADAFTHGLEALGSPLKTLLSKQYSLLTIKNVSEIIDPFQKHIDFNNDFHLKEHGISFKLALVSYFGGISQSNVGTGLAHALAHSFECLYQINHTESISFFCCLAYNHNLYINKEVYKNTLNDTDYVNLIDNIFNFFNKIGFLRNPNVLNILKDTKNREKLYKSASTDICWRLNILKPDVKVIEKLVCKLF